jgi:CHAT domain-containing protein
VATADAGRDHDIVHFAGHARFAAGDPHDSSLLLADGELTARHVAQLKWAAPPYLVFNSACQSARVTQGRSLVAAGGRANGLPAAFLAAGCESYVGHFWPVGDAAAADFAGRFYDTLFRDVDAGAAVLAARRAVRARFDEAADLAVFGAVFFGDAGSANERRDLAMAV